ncbi:MAG: NUDIX hydrolase [Halobacteriaceae archaeon]
MTEDLQWETVERETAYTCPGFDVRHERVRLPDGTETDYDYVHEPPAVVVLPLTPAGEVVLVEEWRQAVDRVNCGLPAGTVEADDEDLTAAARRELAEETGYDAETVEPLVAVEPANGVADSRHHHFVARGCAPTATRDLDADESIRVTTRPFEAFREQVLAGEVADGRATLAVSLYAARGGGAD